MESLLQKPNLDSRLRAQRAAMGHDHYDEVWEGLYVMPPIANDEHQLIQLRIAAIFDAVIGMTGQGEVRAGVNISDRALDWTQNYRIPDVAVFLKDNPAINRNTHWQGGPDFLVEITSEGETPEDKLPFYASINVREVLIIDRHPWSLRLFRNEHNQLKLAEQTTPANASACTSQTLPFEFRLGPGVTRPTIQIMQVRTSHTWII